MKNMFIIVLLLIVSCSNKNENSALVAVEDIKADSIYNCRMQDYHYIDIQETEGWNLERIKQRYKPIQEEDFYLNKGPISEFRIELYNFFNEQERELPILIKEVTWRKSESENYTVWFKKEAEWIRVNSFIWDKDAEF